MMMTMIGEPIPIIRPNPTVQIHPPQWDPLDDIPSPFAGGYNGLESEGEEEGPLLDAFSCDHFRMYEFKVRRCARGRSHDWTECPYAHPGEKARRRDPRRFHYSGTACPDFRKGVGCKKGDSCEFAHGVFECWLHPARYRTQPCKDGSACRRRVCFFAHSPDQLRVLPPGVGSGSPEVVELGSPIGRHSGSFLSSPPVSPPSDSPPMSPSSPQVMSELVASMRGLQLARARMGVSPRGMQAGSMLGSPLGGSPSRPGFSSLPCTPVRTQASLPGLWELGARGEGELQMERVESGRDIRAKMYAKLCKENSLGRLPIEQAAVGPDVGWVSELVK